MPSERRSTGEWDAVVCGGGTSGAVVAAELVRSGRRVLLLEAGPDYGLYADGGWPREMVDSAKCPETHDWGYRSGDDLPGRELLYERARVIGGCSAHNGCTVCWGTRVDYDAWGIPGWSADRLQPLFERCSREMRVRRFGDEELTPLHRGFIEAGLGLGLPAVDDLDSLDGVPGAGAQPSNSPDGVRWNTAFAFLDPVRGRPELEIRDRCLVDRVLVERGRAVGVHAVAGGSSFEARADLVVLAAGVYGTPCVLLRSGIGPADELGRMGIDVLVENRGVGANLHDHPGFELIYPGTDELKRRTDAFAESGQPVPDEQSFVKAASSACEDAAFDLHLFAVPEDPKRGLHIYIANVDPRSRGTVRLSSRDPSAAPLLDHGFLSDPEGRDAAVLIEGVELGRELAARPELAAMLGPETVPGPDARPGPAVRAGFCHYWHPVGSCALGIACDERGRVHGVDGVWVADASLFPQTPRATTNLPTVATALRIAEWLVDGR